MKLQRITDIVLKLNLDKSLTDLLSHIHKFETNLPFGGKPLLLGGDFRQILPIVTEETKDEIINASLNNSYLWHSFEIFYLTENMRLLKDELSVSEKEKISSLLSGFYKLEMVKFIHFMIHTMRMLLGFRFQTICS